MKLRNLLLILVLFVFSCQNKQHTQYAQLLEGKWRMIKFTTNQKVSDYQQFKKVAQRLIYSTMLEFRPNGKMNVTFSGNFSTGYWKVEGKKLITYDSHKKHKFVSEILILNNKELVLYKKMGKVKIVLYFLRVY